MSQEAIPQKNNRTPNMSTEALQER
jgi:hypothetical protein